MSTQVRAAHEVAAPVEQVRAVVTAAAWPEALAARLRDGSTLVAREEQDDGTVRLVVRRQLPEGVPAPLQRFVPADGAVRQTDTWTPVVGAGCSGTWQAELAGAPATLGGTTRLEAVPGGTRWVVEGAVDVRVPLLGGRVESFLAPLVERLVAVQAEVLRTLV